MIVVYPLLPHSVGDIEKRIGYFTAVRERFIGVNNAVRKLATIRTIEFCRWIRRGGSSLGERSLVVC